MTIAAIVTPLGNVFSADAGLFSVAYGQAGQRDRRAGGRGAGRAGAGQGARAETARAGAGRAAGAEISGAALRAAFSL